MVKVLGSRSFIVALALVSCVVSFMGIKMLSHHNHPMESSEMGTGADVHLESPVSASDQFFSARMRIYDELKSGENLFVALRRLEVPASLAERFAHAIGKTTNLRLLMPGDILMIEGLSKSVQRAELSEASTLPTCMSATAVELFAKDDAGIAFRTRADLMDAHEETAQIKVSTHRPQITKEHSLMSGAVSSSIYDAIVSNGGDSQLVNAFSDIFNWQFDFYRDARAGDTYQMIVEKSVADGRFVNYARVLAAEYRSSGRLLRAFYFKSRDNRVSGFFDDQGRSLRNAFLKAPVKLASIGSRFGMRYHPVQKIMKPHNGVDYGAMRGTPFVAVASGVVINAGYTRFNGNWVRIRHANGYETEYLHALNLAKGVRVGARIKQGQVIGYVGKTGMATGYHLHYGMKHRGRYVNPGSQRFARSAGIPAAYMAEYSRSIEAMVIAFNSSSQDHTEILALNGPSE